MLATAPDLSTARMLKGHADKADTIHMVVAIFGMQRRALCSVRFTASSAGCSSAVPRLIWCVSGA